MRKEVSVALEVVFRAVVAIPVLLAIIWHEIRALRKGEGNLRVTLIVTWIGGWLVIALVGLTAWSLLRL